LLIRPVTRFWPMFLFIACLHGFFSYGIKVEFFPWITHEGVRLTVIQWLKLWTWLEFSFMLSYFNFHRIVFKMLQNCFPRNRTTLSAGVIALEYFPAIVSAIRGLNVQRLWSLFRHPVSGTRDGLISVYRKVELVLFGREGR
jgi:hypothetical protein